MKIILYAHQKFDIGVKHHHDNLVRFTRNSALYIWGHVSLVRETALQIKHHFLLYIVCLRDEYNNTNLHVYHYPRSFVMYSITFDFFSFSNNIYTAVLTPLFKFCLVFFLPRCLLVVRRVIMFTECLQKLQAGNCKCTETLHC